ncbi:restriction endonuclease subunit S [Siminovitchia terrae]|uniref:Restriction endonuclease subunit S n=1 Tax=Siminovitchia terrae TaxID=1914933 RepID=A0A429XCY5_SIMTE|nr:restriction endonuclease subunit S [Siminovitchia terrae]RST61219.1 restriction endonuclease subunit S [Siminovitchia terrae]
MPTYKLNDLVQNVINGEWGQEISNANAGVKVIRTTNFSNTGKLDLSKEVVKRAIDINKVEKKKLLPGDIIIEKSGGSPEQPVGRVVFFEEEGLYLCNNFTSILRPNRELVVPKYFLYLMFNLYRTKRVLKFQNKTTGIINLKLDQYLKQTDVSIPSKDAQMRIVEVLDQAFEIINIRQAQINALNELTKNIFIEIDSKYGEESKRKIKDIAKINPAKTIIDKDSDIEVSFVPMNNVSETGELSLKETKKLKEVYSGFTYFEENDILFAKITPCMENGKGCIAKNLINSIGFGSTEFHIIRIESPLTIKWVYQLTMTKTFRKIAEINMTGSAGQKRVPKSFIENYKIKIPNESDLKYFNSVFDQTESLKLKLNQLLEKEKALYNSLLQRAFKGELLRNQF